MEEKQSNKRTVAKFIGTSNLEFGDYILFQEYCQGEYDGVQYQYIVSKPIMAIYLGCFVADQTIGFNYVKWNNDKHSVFITNEYVTRYRTCKEVKEIESHIEWSDFIDVLGHWKQKPNWKEIIKSYRKQNLKKIIQSNEVVW